jgi:hypothetical protein
LFPALQAPLGAQEIRGRVVDEAARQPLVGASITLSASGVVLLRTSSNAQGFFTLASGRPGELEIVVEMIGYASARRSVRVESQPITLPAFVLRVEAVRLDPVEAQARRDVAPVGMARPSHLIAGSRLARLEQHGARMTTALREIPGLRVRETSRGGRPQLCVETPRRVMSMRATGCDWVAVIIDDVPLGNPAEVANLQLSDIESLQYLTPVEAGHRYGLDAGASGAIVVWTRGRGPFRDPARNKQ